MNPQVRAWDKEKQKWYQPVYMDGFWYTDEELGIFAENVAMFTGFKDKIGQDIWEGDVVSDDCFVDDHCLFKGVVGFSDGSFRIISNNCDCGACENLILNSDEAREFKVIGTKFQNSELLTTQDN